MSTTNHIPDELLDKLNKLKNLADGAAALGESGKEEAANAAAKFQALLLKYNLDEASVLEHGIKRKAQMLESTIETEEEWVCRLIIGVAKHCMCQNLYDRRRKLYMILGEKVNVAVCEYMIEQLYNRILSAFELSWFKDKKTMRVQEHIYKEGFLYGCVDAIVERLYREEAKAVEADKTMALMVVNKMALATRFMMDKYPNVRTVGYASGLDSNSATTAAAYLKGQAAGKNMEINKGLAGRQNQRKLE